MSATSDTSTIAPAQRAALLAAARAAMARAHAPYSHFHVGAAVLDTQGRIHAGCNVENAAYPHTMCAERVAIFKAVSEGETEFDVVAVVTNNGGSPCGGCRQVMAEFGLDTIVLIADGSGNLKKEMSVAELLPEAFTPKHLQ